jgi:two-component sensor histidine kinase/PAS domain-containing protein
MEKETTIPQSDFSELKRRAEAQMGHVVTELSPLSDKETAELVHDLRVHQIELEMQNEELRKTQTDLTKAKDEYADLYDKAPVGYLTLNEKGIISKANLTLANSLGIERSSLTNMPFANYVDFESQDKYYLFCEFLKENIGYQSVELKLKQSDSTSFYALIESIVITDMENNTFQTRATVTDISIQKKAEKQIKASLKEKETLLQEIHHRVKNNMAVISSLLSLQANSIEDNQIKKVLKEAQSRVNAMSAVHETLHGSENLSEIDLKTYLSKVTSSIFQTYSVTPDKVKLNIDIKEMPISINQASPLGLIINELISNSLKYAFPEDRTGEITVSIKKVDKELELIVMDDGVGMPEGFDWKNTKSLGLKLVRTLVENQLDGSIDLDNTNGTKFTIKFDIET